MALLIPNAEDFLTPHFELVVNDVPIPEEVYPFIKSVNWDQQEDMIDLITLTLDNTGFQFTDTNLFNFGSTLELLGGYKNTFKSLGQGVIERWVPDFPEGGTPTVVIKAFSPARILKEEFGNEIKKWKKVRASDVVASIVQKRGLPFLLDVRQTPERRLKTYYRSKDKTDWDLIKRLAKTHNYDFWIEWDIDQGGVHVLNFKPFGETSAKSEFTFRYNANEKTNLKSATLDVVLPGQSEQIEVVAWDQELGVAVKVVVKPKRARRREETKFEGIMKKADFQLRTGQQVILDSTKRSPIKVVSAKKFTSEADAIRWAENIFKQQERAFAEATFTIPGIPGMMARQVYQVEGLGTRFSAKYWVTRVNHNFTGGSNGTFTTTWDARIVAEV